MYENLVTLMLAIALGQIEANGAEKKKMTYHIKFEMDSIQLWKMH